jgi:hypothetical protein
MLSVSLAGRRQTSFLLKAASVGGVEIGGGTSKACGQASASSEECAEVDDIRRGGGQLTAP